MFETWRYKKEFEDTKGANLLIFNEGIIATNPDLFWLLLLNAAEGKYAYLNFTYVANMPKISWIYKEHSSNVLLAT